MALDLNLQRGDSAGNNSVRIPQINQQKVVSQLPNSPRMQPAQISNDIGKALSGVGGALGDASKAAQIAESADLRMQEFEAQQEKEKQTLSAQKAVSESSLSLMNYFDEAQASSQPGAAGFTKTLTKGIDEHIAAATKDATPYYKQAYERSMINTRQHLLMKAQDYELKEGLAKEIDDINTGIIVGNKDEPGGSAGIVNKDSSLFDRELGRWVNTIENNTRLNPEAKRKLKEYARSTLVNATGRGEIDRNAAKWNAELNGAGSKSGGGFGSIMEHIFKKEGGYAANDGNGSPVNFGINQGANPDIDVKNLTKEKAAQIYKQRYWDAIGGDSLPPNVALMAMDAAVNQGVGFAKDMIAKSGGDINAMAAMRRDRYEEIIQKNPSKAKYAKVWEDRVASALKQAGSDVVVTPLTLDGTAQNTGRVKIGQPWFDLATFDEQQKFRQYAEQQNNKLESELGKQRQEVASSLELETRNIAEMVTRGVAPQGQPKNLADFQQAYQNPERAIQAHAAYENAWNTAQETSKYNGAPTATLVEVVRETPPAASDPDFAIKSNMQQVRQSAAANIITARQKDPWQFAQATGDFNAGIADPSKPDFADVIKRRAAALPQLMEKYGVGAASVMTGPEASSLSQRMSQMPADARIAMLKTLRQSIGNDSAYSSLLNSIRPDSPVTVLAGNIAAVGGTVKIGSETVSTDKIASRMARGEDLLNPVSSDKKTDGGKGSSFPMPKDTDMRLTWTSAVGTAYAGYPDAEAHSYQAYRAYYAARAAEKGINDGVPDSAIQSEAIIAATGGIGKLDPNGLSNSYRIILPYGMAQDEFQDKTTQIWRQLGPQNGYARTTIDDVRLKPTGENGRYVVTGPDQMALPGKDNKPIIIDLLAPIKPAPSQSQSGTIRR